MGPAHSDHEGSDFVDRSGRKPTSFVISWYKNVDTAVRFSRAWFDSLSVLVARGRAKVSAAATASDWPKWIRDMQYMDVDDSD